MRAIPCNLQALDLCTSSFCRNALYVLLLLIRGAIVEPYPAFMESEGCAYAEQNVAQVAPKYLLCSRELRLDCETGSAFIIKERNFLLTDEVCYYKLTIGS